MSSNFRSFLDKLALSSNVAEAAVADNCRFEERVSDERWKQFKMFLPHDDFNRMTWDDWENADRQHIKKRFCVPSTGIPDTFLPVNRAAWKKALPEATILIRLESLVRPLNRWRNPGKRPLTPDEVKKKFNLLQSVIKRAESGRDYDAQQQAASFFDTWNRNRDSRPAFAALYKEVQTECNDDDWPHALRDRLGIDHWGRRPVQPVPVALMRYPPSEVFATQKAKGLPTACALPTVLDNGMHALFFPSPSSHPFGATLHLDPPKADILTKEILHCRIDYERDHLVKLGYVSEPHQQKGDTLRTSRDLHLTALQIKTGRYDFGEELCGRTPC